MATSSGNPEESNSPENAVTNRKCSKSERVQQNKRDFPEITSDTDKNTELNLANNNVNVTDDTLADNSKIVDEKELGSKIVNKDNNSNENDEVPRFNTSYIPGIQHSNEILNPNKNLPTGFSCTTAVRPSSVPASNKYHIRHVKNSSRNKSASDDSLFDVSFKWNEDRTNKSELTVKQMTDYLIRDDLNKRTGAESLSRTPDCHTLNEGNGFFDQEREKNDKHLSWFKNDSSATGEIRDLGDFKGELQPELKDNCQDNCDNSISNSFERETIENNDNGKQVLVQTDRNSIVVASENRINDEKIVALVYEELDNKADFNILNSNNNYPLRTDNLKCNRFENEISYQNNILNQSVDVNKIVNSNFSDGSQSICSKKERLEMTDENKKPKNTLTNSHNNENNYKTPYEECELIVKESEINVSNSNTIANLSESFDSVNVTSQKHNVLLDQEEQTLNEENNVITLNIKKTFEKFNEKVSRLPFEVTNTNTNNAKDPKLRFRKCYSDSKTCSKIYPIYENVNKMKNGPFVVTTAMESLNVKNLEKSMLSNDKNKNEENINNAKLEKNNTDRTGKEIPLNNNQKYKNRKSYHQDVEEALSSLLWQPYEYQNVYKNSDTQSSSSLSSSSSSSASSSSCSTISSRGSFRYDLERSNNGPVHRQQSVRSGNNASDLHLRTEMVNNPAANGYENLLSQWRKGNGSRDAAELSNASRLMVGVSPEVRCLRAVASLEQSAYVFCDCDACFSDMRLEVCEDVTPVASSSALSQESSTQPVGETTRSNNVTLNQQNPQHLSIGAANQANMQQQQQQRSVIENGYQRSSLSSVNVVGLPRPIPQANTNRPTGNGLFTNHPRNVSEPITMVQSNQFKYNNNVNCANIVPILSHQRHSSQIESGTAHTINHIRSASVPKTVPHTPQKIGESRSGPDLKVIVGNDQQQQQQQQSQQRQQRLPLNVSNVNVNYYRAVPVNVVSSVPTIQCVNSSDSNVSNVNIVQAMPTVNTPNNCTYTTCTSATNYVQNYANLPPQNTQQQNFSFPNSPYNTVNNNQMQMHPPPLQQCAITTFGSSIITQHFPSGSTYNLSTSQVPNNVQINTANQNVQQSTQTHISYQNSNENNVIQQNGTIVVPSMNNQTSSSHTFSTTEVTVHSPPVTSQIQVVPSQTVRPPPPATINLQEVRTRTFTSTEAQTDETAVSTGQNELGANREQRRRERRERRHHRRVSNTNHRHGTVDHGTQWNSLQNERLPDILNSHMPPSYASAINNVPPPQPVLPNAIVSNPIVPPGTVVQTMVPNSIVPSGVVGSPIVPFPPPVVPGQVPLVQGAAPVPVPVPAPSGFRFPFPAAGFRRTRYSEEPPKSCCGLLAWKPGSLRWFIALIAVVAVCCVLVGTVLGAMRSSGRDHLTVSLLMIGVGIVLVTVSGVAWRLTSHDSSTCRSMLGLGSTESVDVCTRRFVPRLPPSYGRPHHPYAAMMYPEFQYRPPPPSYQASMQEYRLRLLLLDRGNTPQIQAGIQNAVSPPPTYRSHTGSLLRAPLTSRRDAQSEYSCPPSYRSQTSSTRPTNTLPAPSVLHSREQSLSLSESNNEGSVNVVLNNNDEDIALDNITLDSLKMEPESEINPLKMMLKGGSTSDLDGSKDGNLVTIVQTSDQSPVIVTVSGSSNAEDTNNVQINEIQSEMQILAHL